METHFKTYEDLTKQELHDILRLRSEVFVVEQKCAYQDIDGKDYVAVHVLLTQKHKLIAYARLFKPSDYFKEAAIGRVLVKKDNRGRGLAQELIRKTIEHITHELGEPNIKLSAQTYLIDFYNNLGFITQGEPYLEDGIPHIEMVYSSKF